jgi:predicted NAD/FAD-binding protein
MSIAQESNSVKKKIAIIGTGISGLTCGYLLSRQHDIVVFEANDYVGGHTATIDVTLEGETYAIDSGFIVYNDWTYANFIKLLDKLGVETQATEMSFSVKNQTDNLEYNGNTLNSLFAQRRNLLRPKFYRMVRDIIRFNRLCKQEVALGTLNENTTLGDFIGNHNFSETFTYNYLLPMCAAIWSASLDDVKHFPLNFFLRFFNNHGLLNITDRPQWRTLVGGSREYIAPLTENFKDKILLNAKVNSVTKQAGGYLLTYNQDSTEKFDEVIFACHSDQALALLPEANIAQQEILAAIPYAPNEVVLHTDTSLLPKRKLAWASWNYLLKGYQGEHSSPAAVTYNMNILQNLDSAHTFCVTLNNTADIDPSKILAKFTYAHPQFSQQGLIAQQRRAEICGQDGLHFCGAYWYNGFHEDGVRSALDVCHRFGAQL